MRSTVVAALITCFLVLVPAGPSLAVTASEVSTPAIQNGYKLARHEDAVRYRREARFWSCWTPGTRPLFSAWNGQRWVRWATAERIPGFNKCGGRLDTVVFSFYTSLLSRKVKDRAYHLLTVKEHCRGCETAKWTLPVLPRGAQAG
jgi:hypothetical protein